MRSAGSSPEEQLDYVFRYLDQPQFRGRLKSLGDMYMAVLYPKAIGKADDYVLFRRTDHTETYAQNARLDGNEDGEITKAEAVGRVAGPLYAKRAGLLGKL